MATFADAPVPGRANALQRAAYAGPLTRTIALVPEVDTVYTEPFHVSTQLASLDYVSGGRAGWIATAAESPEAAAAVGRTTSPALRWRRKPRPPSRCPAGCGTRGRTTP